MNLSRILTILVFIAILSGLAISLGQAQEPAQPEQPQGELSIEATVASKFTYQGMLREDGYPVSGTRDMTFRLYSNSTCATLLGGEISMPAVPVSQGLFSVELSFSQSYFNGQGLWLGIQVGTTKVACQEIVPVPYALSLRPGAHIEGTTDELLVVDNTSTSTGDIDTLILRNDSGVGEALEVGANSNAVAAFATYGYGVLGQTNTVTNTGVLARGKDTGPDLILAGNANTGDGDDGRLHSDPAYAGSDLFLVSNDAIRLELDNDADGADADFEIRNKDDALIFNVDESGDVTMGGNGIAAFPRPAYNSGWISIARGEDRRLTHNLEGNIDNYVIDLNCYTDAPWWLINNHSIGADTYYYPSEGLYLKSFFWHELTTTQVVVTRQPDEDHCDQFRLRIWVYP